MVEIIKETEATYERLFDICRRDDFYGFDPFDGLSSRLFQSLPLLKNNAVSRLIWLQLVKRSPLNLRGLLRIDKGLNPKALGLFLSAEMNLFKRDRDERHLANAEQISKQLIEVSLETTNGIAWGYPFDWQSRAFYAPRNTPTIVPTVFAANGLLDLFEQTQDPKLFDLVSEVGEFILNDLNRPIENETEVCFSYTPIDNSVILNASLLAAELLARLDALESTETRRNFVQRAVSLVLESQKKDGSWSYGPKLRHRWIDNFHTAFILVSLERIRVYSDLDCGSAIENGIDFWIGSFFTKDGAPKYFHDNMYPLDVHSAAAAIHGLSELSESYPDTLRLADSVMRWTLDNMLLGNGRFRYQISRFTKTNHQFTRWNDAWMCYGISRFLRSKSQ